MMDETQNRRARLVDPEPVSILMVCFAGVGMLSAVSNTIIQILAERRHRREEGRREREILSEALIIRDHLVSAGSKLQNSLEAFGHDARLALSFVDSNNRRDGDRSP